MPEDFTLTLPASLDALSELSTVVIAAAAAVHLFAYFILYLWSGRDLRVIAGMLDRFTRGLSHRSSLDTPGRLPDQIDAFLADIRDALDAPPGTPDRAALLSRIRVLDESRGYLNSLGFATAANLARTMVEAYPLAGVLGTILAIGATLAGGDAAEPSVSAIVGRFGDAIWSTFAGLVAAIVLMFINGLLEPRFSRVGESRQYVREVVARAKRELLAADGLPTRPPVASTPRGTAS
ncbi:MAG: MotA/TolQ/ExbB proton channel family protein [Planctomycetota bacterium]